MNKTAEKQHDCADYHVAWICPVADIELLPARLMLDTEHPTPPYNTHFDENTYICGEINGHTVVIATCPQGETGNLNAGRLTGSMFKTFPNIRVALLVGIGSGVPRAENISNDPTDDVHLGDVIVGWPGDGKPACVYYEQGKMEPIQNPDWRLTNALSVLSSDYDLGRTTFEKQLARLKVNDKMRKKFAHPGLDHDMLFEATYHHSSDDGQTCMSCDQKELVQRPQRTEESKNDLVFHQGRIVTTTAVIENAETRNQINKVCDGAMCIEVEAAGINTNRRCLVVRGVSDYADSHRNSMWNSYAAGNAAAFTRELLCRIQSQAVRDIERISEENRSEDCAPRDALWLIPFVRPQYYVGRENELARLNDHVSSGGGRRIAIYGLGGSGKTALALELVHRLREQNEEQRQQEQKHSAMAIFWVPAISVESFEQAYREVSILARIPGYDDHQADVKKLVKDALDEKFFLSWLLIIDNADDADVLFAPLQGEGSRSRLIDYLPDSQKGSIIFTTRSRGIATKLAENNVISLGELSKVEAEQVLQTRLFEEHRVQLQDHETVRNFLETATYLALAIVQAVAFINTNDVTLSEYISLYKKSEKDAIHLLSEDFEDQGRYQGKYEEAKNPIGTTWYISFEHIRKQNSLAADYFSSMACVRHNGIPETILPASASRLEHTKAIGTLKAYAFLSERQQQSGYRHPQRKSHNAERPVKLFDIHPLVHLAMVGWLTAHGKWDIRAEQILVRLCDAVLSNYRDAEARTVYLPHASHIVSMPKFKEHRAQFSLSEWIADCDDYLGRYVSVEHTLRRLYESLKHANGKEHRDTQRVRNKIGVAMRQQGRYIEAEAVHRESLLHVPEEDHIQSLRYQDSLADAIVLQGKHQEAEEIYRETLSTREKLVGKDHRETISSKTGLAYALTEQGKFKEAINILQDLLSQNLKQLGPEHATTLSLKVNLAYNLGKDGRVVEAIKLNEETLAIEEKRLGKEHPSTLAIRGNLAVLICRQGNYKEAEEMHRQTLALRIKVLGGEHPDTISSINNLAMVSRSRGDLPEALRLYQRAVALNRKVLGEEHPLTLHNLSYVGHVFYEQGKHKDALACYKRAYLGYRNRYGKDHPGAQRNLKYLIMTQELLNRQSSSGRSPESSEPQVHESVTESESSRKRKAIEGDISFR